LNALTALVYLAFVGPHGLKQAANASHRVACYARSELKKAGFEFKHDAPFLREFAVKVDDPRGMNRYLLEWGIIGGYELEDGLLLAFTEKRTREEVDELVYCMKSYQFDGVGKQLTVDEDAE
jgi:glycine dehydrogenase subunit 1